MNEEHHDCSDSDPGEERFMGHKVDRRHANVFIEHFPDGSGMVAMDHYVLRKDTTDGWHFWIAPGGVLLVTIREGAATYHHALQGVHRSIVLPRRDGDPGDPFEPAQPICEYDSEVIEDLSAMETEVIVKDAVKMEIAPVYFHNEECLARWKEEQGGEGQAEGAGAAEES